MFWRNDPKVGGSKGGGAKPDWPRNGAILKGLVHELPTPVENCNRWLEVRPYFQNRKLPKCDMVACTCIQGPFILARAQTPALSIRN